MLTCAVVSVCQISQHQVSVVQSLAKMMGWNVLSLTNSCGVGAVEQIGTASSVILASPNGERYVLINIFYCHAVEHGCDLYQTHHSQTHRNAPWAGDGCSRQRVAFAARTRLLSEHTRSRSQVAKHNGCVQRSCARSAGG